MARICEGLAHGELVNLVLLVEAEGEAEHVSIVVGGGAVVENVAGGHPLPSRPGQKKFVLQSCEE